MARVIHRLIAHPFARTFASATVRGMTTFAALVGALSATNVDTLEGFDKPTALDAGINPGWVHIWGRLHDTCLLYTSDAADE